jgi:VanZ family protein
MKLIKNLLVLKIASGITATLWTIFILYMSLKPAGNEPPLFDNIDKVAHFTFYFVFVVLWCNYFRLKNNFQTKSIRIILVFSFFFGLAIELCQELLTQTRHADIYDVLANGSGGLLGYFFVILVKKFVADKSFK